MDEFQIYLDDDEIKCLTCNWIPDLNINDEILFKPSCTLCYRPRSLSPFSQHIKKTI